MKANRASGMTLLETLMVAALGTVLLGVAVPPLIRASTRLRVRSAAAEICGTFRLARSYAIRYDANVGVKFRVSSDGTVTFALYRDGDHDGVLTADIDRGVDPEVRPPQVLQSFGRGVGFGFPPGLVPRDPSDPRRNLGDLDDPIRFNGSDIASFSSVATATPGSIYLTDHVGELVAVRVVGMSGRTSVVRYDAAERVWQ
jgi:type II secretory pathway pseudopilin PulG